MKKNSYFSVVLFICFIYTVKSYGQIEFQHHYGTGQVEVCHDAQPTSDGGYIMSGMTYDTKLSFGVGAALIKTDANGAVEWTFAGDSMSTTRYAAVVEDPSDNGFIVATCTGSNWRSSTSGDPATWIYKVDQNGVLVWSKLIVGDLADLGPNSKNRYDYFQSIRATSDGNFIAVGRSELGSYTVINPGLGSSDMIAIKFNSSGNIIWARAIGSTTYEYGFTVNQCADGDYIFYGYSGGLLTLTKITSDGNTITWSNSYNMGNTSFIPGGQYTGWGSIYATNSAMIQTADGGFVVTGYNYSATFGGDDMYVMKVNNDGSFAWSKRYGSGGDESASGVVQLAGGDLIIAGTTRSVTLRTNDRDMLLIRLDNSNGNVVWCKSYNAAVTGVTEYETVTSIKAIGANSILIAGAVDYNGDCGAMDMSLYLMDISGALSCSGAGNLVMTDRTAVLQNAPVVPTLASVFVLDPITPNVYDGGGFGAWVLDCDVEICSFVLPIELTSFNGKSRGSYNKLDWITASEINNDYFTLEKSSNAIDWEILGEISGAGNSNVELNYDFNDFTPFDQVTYYRLKQTDFDGRYEYFNIVAVQSNSKELGIGNPYPNPANNHFSFSHKGIKGALTISIYNIQGMLISKNSYPDLMDDAALTISTKELARGMYFVQFQAEGIDETKKINISN